MESSSFILAAFICSALATFWPGGLAGAQSIWFIDGNQTSATSNRLSGLTTRIGPNMQASCNYHDFTDISLEDSRLAWSHLNVQSSRMAQEQVDRYHPLLNQLVSDANVSASCERATELTMKALRKLDFWAFKMYNSIGNFPPVGLLDGSITDTGSFRSCVDVKTNLQEEYANYCILSYRPIVPSRPPFHMIFQQLEGMQTFFPNEHLFHDLTNKAQFFNYIYLRTGVCVPSECQASDVQLVVNLLAQRLAFMPGPVKCFSKTKDNPTIRKSINEPNRTTNNSIQVSLNQPLNKIQSTAVWLISIFFSVVFFSTIWHIIELASKNTITNKRKFSLNCLTPRQEVQLKERRSSPVEVQLYKTGLGLRKLAFDYFSIIKNCADFFDTSTKPNEITCLHGLRVLTMMWIILVHTLQYNAWSGFTRVFESVTILQNPILHPLYNANYVVDNFFLMSGLLSAYSTWYLSDEGKRTFSPVVNLISRYLRLTPQVMLISLLYILLPSIGQGPFWYDMTNTASKYCQDNWWINLLHIQAFYKEEEMCNLVSWWISVDMLYYLLAMIIVYIAVNTGHLRAFTSTLLIVAGFMVMSAYKHFEGNYPPGNLGTMPQVAEVWSGFVVDFSWSPWPHVYPFFFGLWLGNLLANSRGMHLVRRWSSFGNVLSMLSLAIISMSSHIWMSGKVELGSQYISTGYNIICTITWASALGWIILACHYGCLPLINKILSIKPFVILSKASFIIYLSHMLIVRLYFGSNNVVIELSPLTLTYVIIGNCCLSIVFGAILCITFEGPCLKFQRTLMRLISSRKHTPAQVQLEQVEQTCLAPQDKQPVDMRGRIFIN